MMTTIAAFIIGLVVGICVVLLILLLLAIMNVSGQISREEEMSDWRKKKGLD